MKKFIKHLFVVAAIALAPSIHAQKFGHFDLDSLLSIMPEMEKANKDAADYYKTLEAQMLQMQTELDTKLKDYEANSSSWSPAIKKLKEDELNSLQQRIQQFQMTAQSEFNTQKQNLVKPIYDKINKAVKDIAKEKGYKYVFDSSKGAALLMYADPADDIFALLKVKLNIPNPAPKTGGGTAPPPNPGGGN
ncbi:MAG: outer membrane protein [Bacteroidetes bacterium]|nr:MAG: outer membrane protein [Bacteroidota bacterium]